MPSLQDVHVLVVGDLMLDRYWFGTAERMSQEAPVPVVNVAETDDRPGGAANTALNIVSMGARCTLVGVVGDDATGRALEQRLSAAGVRCDFVRVGDWSTIIKLRIVSRQRQLLRVDFESELPHSGLQPIPGGSSNEPLRLEVDTGVELLKRVSANLPGASSLVLQDYDKGTLADPAPFIDAAHDAGLPVIVDPKHKSLAVYAGADLVKPNIHEFRTAVGPVGSYAELINAARNLLEEHRFGALVVTQGDAGMTVVDAEHGHRHLPAQPVDVFDVTGAGDTAAAALAVTRSLGWPAAECAAVANVASGLVVAKSGTATISGPELTSAYHGDARSQSGILKRDQLLDAVAQARRNGERIVFTNGCFDILHAGHVTYLEEARALGDRLVVAVNDDASVARLKGSGRPVNPLDRRLRVLAALTAVDWVVGFGEDTPEALLEALRPQLLVKGGDYLPDQVVGADIVRRYGGQVRVLGLVEDCSTTAIVNQITDTD
ncbi:MAG: bifunctional D-glycero-beta-D-manno-heptose-7-phosphate kinase/D-glycero-beta-D-manno-heptose 1-phosphate adenylyltransferase HldE [Pseudomonadota bacterium]